MIPFVHIFMAITFSCLVGFYFQRAWGLEHGNEFSARDRLFGLDRKDKIIDIGIWPLILPCCLAVLYVVVAMKLGLWNALLWFFRYSADLLLTMSLYYVALLFLMPVLRRYISARACAVAWLLPALLYSMGYYNLTRMAPRIVLHCPKKLTDMLIPLWFAGFVIIFAASLLSHLHFRRRMLDASYEEYDPSVLQIWQQESEELGFKTPIRLVRCKLAKTPFSMGNSKSTRVTALPVHPYTESELRLIFRHELHHIQRNDADSKLFFTFLRALFWFHPLLWLALREAGRDMELSCDEIVLDTSDAGERKLYANLLLNTTGERRGFTTCLSADAASLRYRLRNVMQKRHRHTGTLLLMVLLFTCLMCHGIFAISDERIGLGEVFSLESVDDCLYETSGEPSRTDAALTGESREELLSYLATLSVEHLNGARYNTASEQTPRLFLSHRRNYQAIWLGDGSITIFDPNNEVEDYAIYYIREDIDWQKIEACFR